MSGHKFDRIYSLARGEHAWLLRAEGYKWREIAARLGGISNSRAIQISARFGRRMSHALRRSRVTMEVS